MGAWIYAPSPAREACAALHDGSHRVELRHSGTLVEDLLTELNAIQARFTAVADKPVAGVGPAALAPRGPYRA